MKRAWRVCGALLLLTACGVNPLSRKYEYEEEVYVDLDGSATVYVNAAVPALVALRGVDLPIDPGARLDRQQVRALFESPVTRVANVSTSRRDGRRYVHVRLSVDDIGRLSEAGMFAWSRYHFGVNGETAEYEGVDAVLLVQRRAFLRADSALAIVMITDEDDSNVDLRGLGGKGWAFAARDFPGSRVFRASSRAGTTAPRGPQSSTSWRA